MPAETAVTPAADQPPEDYAAYEQWANNRNPPGADVEPEREIPSEEAAPSEAPAEEEPEAESAGESETPTEEEQEEEETETEDDPDVKKAGKGVQKRFSKLTKKIRELEARLEAKPAADVEPPPEPAAPKAAEKPADGKPVAPKLAGFNTYEEYEAAHNKYVEELTDWKADQKDATRQADENTKRAAAEQAQRDREWVEAASEYKDFNAVVGSDEVKISAAMEAVMRLNADGVHLAYYLGKHPEESLRIAKVTLAANEAEWPIAIARAGRELGKIEAQLKREASPKAPAPKQTPKQVSSAPKPPARVGGTRAAPPPDIHDEDTAADYAAWERAREAQLKRR